MANQGLPGGRPQQARPLDQGRYVGNPNHMAQQGIALAPPMMSTPMPVPTITTPGQQGLRDENGNLVTNNVSYGDGSANNQAEVQVPNRTPINGAIVGGTIATTPPPSNINTMAAQGIRAAGLGTAMGMGYTPSQVNVAGQSATVTPQTLSGTDMSAYMNPYDDAVVQANEADILRGAQMGMNNLQGQAQAARAFGGSRHGVAMGEIGRDTVSQLAQASAGLRQAGFQNAQNAALADIQNNLQGQLANQQAGMGDISNQMQTDLANQQAGLAGAQQRLGAANQLGQLSTLGFGMGEAVNRNLATQGGLQQGLEQALFDAARKQFQGFVNQPVQGLNYVTGALNANPVSTPRTVTQTKTPGLFDYLTLGANAYTGNQAQPTPF